MLTLICSVNIESFGVLCSIVRAVMSTLIFLISIYRFTFSCTELDLMDIMSILLLFPFSHTGMHFLSLNCLTVYTWHIYI